jgi:hypothetical protein
MLPLGRIGIRAERGEPRDCLLTAEEQVTLMTLWVVARSPLMVGGDLPSSDPATIALLGNAEVLAVHAASHGNREVFREGPLVLWAADGPEGEQYVAAFNLGEEELVVALDSQDVGLPAALDGEVTELWSGRAVPTRPVAEQSDAARGVAPGSTAIDLRIPRHGAVLLRHRSEGSSARE